VDLCGICGVCLVYLFVWGQRTTYENKNEKRKTKEKKNEK